MSTEIPMVTEIHLGGMYDNSPTKNDLIILMERFNFNVDHLAENGLILIGKPEISFLPPPGPRAQWRVSLTQKLSVPMTRERFEELKQK